MTNIMGDVIDGGDVERWLRDFVKRWMPEYLAEYERRKGLEPHYFPEIWAIETSSEFTSWTEDHLPHLVVVSAGLEEQPIRRSDADEASWGVAVSALAGSQDRATTRAAMFAYITSIRWMVRHRRSLERAEVRDCLWIDESYREVAEIDSQSIAAGTIVFKIDVVGVQGPGRTVGHDPRIDPYPSAPPTPNDPVIGPILPGGSNVEIVPKEGS